MIPNHMDLFRAVRCPELESIRRIGAFSNLPGLECKYFALTLEHARLYARMAQHRFADGPYTVVATTIELSAISAQWRAVVDFGIQTITVPTHLLYGLGQPRIIEDQ